jgi:hypothetical protein
METEGRKPIVLRNGTLKDPVTGQFLTGPTEGKITSSERGRELALRRHEVSQSKARKGLVKAYEEHTGTPGGRPSDAYGELAAEFARSALANAMEKPRDATAAAKLALRLADMLPADERAAVPVVAVQINVAPEVAEWMARKLEEE